MWGQCQPIVPVVCPIICYENRKEKHTVKIVDQGDDSAFDLVIRVK
jgi:hypothetical protein